MTNIAIRVENLSKLYTIGRSQQRHDTLPRFLRNEADDSPNSHNSGSLN